MIRAGCIAVYSVSENNVQSSYRQRAHSAKKKHYTSKMRADTISGSQ